MKQHVIFVVILVASLTWAQDGAHTVPAPAVELPYTTILTPPTPVSGLQMPLTFSAETERSNYVRGSLQAGAGYDDNVLAQPSDHISDVSYLILPSIEIGQTRERWTWDFAYRFGMTINQRIVERNEAAHNLHLLFDYRLTPHVTAQIREGFEKTNSLFSGMLGSPSAGPGPLQQPNTSGITPFTNRTANTSGLDLTYQFSASSLVGASGNFYFVNYDAPANTPAGNFGLIDSRAWGGNAYYAHRFSNRIWLGATNNFQRLLFDPGYRTDLNRTLLFAAFGSGTPLTLSVWAGPEYASSILPSGTVGLPGDTVSQVRWETAAGAELSWQGRKTSARFNYLRQTSDGSGLAQAVNLQQAGGELARRLTTRWTTSVALTYAKNNPLNAANGVAPYRTWLASIGFDYRMTDNLAFNLRYGRDQLQYSYAGASATAANRNRVFFAVSYSFARPLGR